MSNQLSNGLLARRRRTVATSAPVNTSLPAIGGTPLIGNVVTASTGSWIGTSPITYTYQWKRNGVNISGATSAAYTIVTADGDTTLTVTVTATNVAGFASATSAGRFVAFPMVLTLMTGITATSGSGGSITIPASAQVGDIAIFYQFARASSGTPGTVTITGTTTIANQVAGVSSTIRAMLSYKILDAGDIGASRTGLNGGAQDYKTIRIIRPSKAITSITTGSIVSAYNTSGFTNTITTPSGAPAFIAGRMFNQQSSLSPSGSLFTSGNRLNESGGAQFATLIEIQNTTLASRTMGSSASTGIIVGQSFYGVVT